MDDKRNDIYIHIDKKTSEVPFDKLKAAVKEALLCFIPRISVQWGGDSQVRVTMMLLEEAVKTDHIYYHFISGVDMPLKTQDEFHRFFKENQGKVFVQTMIGNSRFRDCIADSYMRCIDWKRGAPYTFTIEDYDMLMNSGMFFARKFDEHVDMEIVNKLYKTLSK